MENQKLVTIYLLGEIGDRFGHTHNLDVKSPQEAIKALCTLCPGFKEYLYSSADNGVGFQVSVDGYECPKEELSLAADKTITIAPVVAGSGGVGRVLLGVTLIAAAVAIPFAAVGGGTALGMLGASLALGGITQLLSPKPEQSGEEGDRKQSYLLGNAARVGQLDDPIPLLYGRMRISNPPIITSAVTTIETNGEGSIGGSGGGPSSSDVSTAEEEEDTLFARQTAKALYALCEGPIRGFAGATAKQSVFVNGTPLENNDGTNNFKRANISFRAGTDDQNHIPGFPAREEEFQVGVKVRKDEPVTRTLADPDADAVIIRLYTPNFQKVEDEGDIVGLEVDYRVELATNGGPYVSLLEDSFNGKASSGYTRDHRIELPPGVEWNIRVVRESDDAEDSSKEASEIYWQSYTSVNDGKFRYQNTALLGLEVRAEEFSTFPQLDVELYGLKVKVPSNYDAGTRTYSGTWDGTFKIDWTDNPVWCLYDLLTNSRYGLGDYIEIDQIDKWSFYDAAQYCDEQVPTGVRGLTEPRYSCNVYLNSRQGALDLVRTFTSMFRGHVYWSAGSLTLLIDRPQNAVRIYTPANAVFQSVGSESGGETGYHFQYECADQNTRCNRARVTWLDPELNYQTSTEIVALDENLRPPHRTEDINAAGCTSRYEAARRGRWAVYTHLYESDTISFSVASDGLLVNPGDVVKVMDPARSNNKWGGRITSAIATSITLDRNIALDANRAYKVSAFSSTGQLRTRDVVNTGTTTDRLEVTEPFDFVPLLNTPWILESDNLVASQWKILAVTENGDGSYSLAGIRHEPSKFGFIERDRPLKLLRTSRLPDLTVKPSAPTDLRINEIILANSIGTRAISDVEFSWRQPKAGTIAYYQVQYRKTSNPQYREAGTSESNSYRLRSLEPGEWKFRVRAWNQLGQKSKWESVKVTLYGKTKKPDNIRGVYLTAIDQQTAEIRWKPTTELDVQLGGRIFIKHSPKLTANLSWNDGAILTRVPGNQTSTMVPLLKGQYMIRVQDSSGNWSSGIEYIVAENAERLFNRNIVLDIDESTAGFPGTRSNVEVVGGVLRLATNPSTGRLYSQGTYTLSQIVDLGDARGQVRMVPRIGALVSDTTRTIQAIEVPISEVGSISGAETEQAGQELQISISNDGITFGNWVEMGVGIYEGYKFKFRLVLTSDDQTSNILVDNLRVRADVPDRFEGLNASETIQVANTGTTTVTFQNGFVVPPEVVVTIQNGQAGDYAEVTDINKRNFKVRVLNNSGTQVSRKISYIAKGYGVLTN